MLLYRNLNPTYRVVEIPRPGSAKYSNAEANALLTSRLQSCTAINAEHEIAKTWNSGFGMRVHVPRVGQIRVLDWNLNESRGIRAMEDAMVESPRYLGVIHVLITADTDGWVSPEKKQVLDRLLQPACQVYVVNGG